MGQNESTSESGDGSTSLGTSTTEGGSSSSTGDEPVVCVDPNAGVAWAGNWGKLLTHGCLYSDGLPEPFVIQTSYLGFDCFIITAEVWIPGVTEVEGNEALVRAEIYVEDPAGITEPLEQAMSFHERVGNNYRYRSPNPGTTYMDWWGHAPLGEYQLYVRFSYLEENLGCWYTIGQGDGPVGGAPRTIVLM